MKFLKYLLLSFVSWVIYDATAPGKILSFIAFFVSAMAVSSLVFGWGLLSFCVGIMAAILTYKFVWNEKDNL